MFGVITPHGRIEVTMMEYFDLVEGRLTFEQIMLRRKLVEWSKTNNSGQYSCRSNKYHSPTPAANSAGI